MCNIYTAIGLLCIFLVHIVSSQRCPYGWMDRPRGDSCYLIAIRNMRYTWLEGRARCQQLQANYVKLDNVQERDWLMKTLRNVTSVFPEASEWWTGAHTKGDGGGWVWSKDDSPLDNSLITWITGSPPATDGKHCAKVDGQGFNSSNCYTWKRIVCERPKSLPLVCKSDGGWQYSNGSCYKYFNAKRTWDDASAYCKRYSSHLSYVTSDDSQRFLWDMSRDNKMNMWTGLRSVPTKNNVSWTWDRGPALGTGPTYWVADNPGTIDPENRNSTCVKLGQASRRKMSWLVASCSELNAYSCQKPQGVCQDGWLQHQDNCYSFNPMFSLPWDQANSYCSGQGGTQLKFITSSDQMFINLYLQEQTLAGVKSIWIGATDNNSDTGPFKWADGRSLGQYENWAPQNPVNKAGSQDCGYIDTTDTTGRWQTSSDCTQLKSFVCMIPVNTPVKQVTTPAPTYLCDPGWVVYGQNCYQFNDTDLSWTLARATCKAASADLAMIPDAGTQEFLDKKISGADFWIGLQDRNNENNWVWLDSTPLNTQSYTNWNKGEPNNLGNENCVGILGNWGQTQFGKWNDFACNRNYNFICQKVATNSPNQPTQAATVRPIISKKCGAFWEESPGSDYCYQFNEDMLSWTDAKDMCAVHGGQLASITSVKEQFYIAGRIRGINTVALWTGANDRSSEGGWTWDDASPFAYMNWVPGEPNDYGKGEDCGIIAIKTARWNDYDCLRRNGYICKKLGNVKVTTPSPSISPATVPAGKFYGCPPGWRPYLNSCYLVVKDKVTWSAARTKCRAAGGDLSSIGNKAENQFINSQIQKEKCINIHPNDTECEEWAESGECQKNPLWMAANCKDACALCEFVCADRHTLNECATWADLGECSKNSEWMHVHCALSCGRCDSGTNSGVWIGFNDLTTTDSFVWADGASNTYTNWARNEPNNYRGHKEDCVLQYTNGGQWNDDQCDSTHGYVCKSAKRILATTQQSPFAVGCTKGSLGYQHYCYQFNNIPLKWQSAENTCKQRGGHLATVNNYVTQSFIASELTNRDDVYWIGLSDTATPGTYKWATGDSLLFTPWDKSHNGSERSTCVAMRTTQPTGLWQNYQCNVIKPYICQLPRTGFTPAPTTPTPTTSVPLPCATGWKGFGAFCYRAFRMGSSDRKTWSEAEVYCQGLGGDLMSIHSKDQENFVENTLLRFFYNANFWIGLSDRAKEGSYVWTDGTPFDYTNWYTGEPNNANGDEDCVEFNQLTRRWNDNSCFLAKDFICQIPRGVTVPTTTVRTTTPVASCAGSESGWVFFNGSCFFVSPSYGHNAKKSWYEARRYCMSEGGDLISIHSLNDNNFITSQITKRTQGIYWIGLNQLGRDDYVWSDGTPTDYLKWRPGEPNDAFGGQLCVNMYGGSLPAPGTWNDDNCMDSNNFICMKNNGSSSPVTPAPTATLTGGCPPSYVPFDNKCFAIGGLTSIGRMNWTDARDQCRKQGTGFDIVSINSYADQAFLLVYVKQQGVTSPLWIGLNDRYQNGHYEWQDNTEVTYTNWNKGEPSDRYSYMHYNRQDCVSMTFGTGDTSRVGRWNDDRCTDKKGYICQTFKSNTYATAAPTASSCKSGYQHFGTSCYRTVTSPTTWQGGQTACQADGGNLVSITDMYEQSFVDTIAHINNIMNGFWTGLSDRKTPGIYGWYDGWPVYFTRWGKDEPTKNAGEGCVAQQGQYWNDTLCQQNFPFICEISSITPPPTTPVPPGFCPDKTWVPNGDYCYSAAPSARKSWPEANYICQQMGMQMLSAHSQEEMTFVKNLLEQQTTTRRYSFTFNLPNVWFGMTKSKSGGFVWSDGSPVNYFNWHQGEPSDVNGTNHENCVEFYRSTLLWNDVDCFVDRSYVCKVKKTLPSTTTTTTTTTTTPAPSRRPNSTLKPPATANPNPNLRTSRYAVYSMPTPVVGPQVQNTAPSSNLSGGQIAGIVIGIIAFIIIVVVIVFIVIRRRPLPPSSPSAGFDNAMYSKDQENVSVSNGINNVYHSGVPSDDISEA